MTAPMTTERTEAETVETLLNKVISEAHFNRADSEWILSCDTMHYLTRAYKEAIRQGRTPSTDDARAEVVEGYLVPLREMECELRAMSAQLYTMGSHRESIKCEERYTALSKAIRSLAANKEK